MAKAAQDNPFLQTNPILQALIEAATRPDLFSGKPLTSPAGQLGIFAQQAGLSPAPATLAERLNAADRPRRSTQADQAELRRHPLRLPRPARQNAPAAVAAQLAQRSR